MKIITTIGLVGLGYYIRDRKSKIKYSYDPNSIKACVKRVACQKIEQLFLGDYGSRYKPTSSQPKYSVDYDSKPIKSAKESVDEAIDSIWFLTKEDANVALDELEDFGKEYSVVTVNDYIDIAKIINPHLEVRTQFMFLRYGWESSDINHTHINKLRNGTYILSIPNPKPV